jgi:regulator of protease activity HflC (stomatin/prohibitin superfamily)
MYAMRYVMIGVVSMFLLVGGCTAFGPMYNVYSERMQGEAALARSIAEKQVAVQTALAKKESATLLADAEVLRAGGVAQANKIIGDSLKGNEAYLRYLWIHNLEEGKNQIIYIPTEAGLPILEAGKREHRE